MRAVLLCLLLIQCQLFGSCWDAAEYVKSNQLQKNWAEHFFFNRYQFQGNEIVLDIGCGDGAITKKIANLTKGKVIGLDNSPSMVAYAISNHISDNLVFKLSQADDSAFYKRIEHSCNLIVSFHCLHWVHDHDTVLRGVKEALVTGGVAFLRFCSDGYDPIQEIAEKLCISEKWKTAFQGFVDPITRFSAQEYREKLMRYDFEIISLKEAHDEDVLANIEGLKKHLVGWLPYYKFLGPKLGEIFVDEVIEIYLKEHSPQKNGTIILPDSYLEVEIRKR